MSYKGYMQNPGDDIVPIIPLKAVVRDTTDSAPSALNQRLEIGGKLMMECSLIGGLDYYVTGRTSV